MAKLSFNKLGIKLDTTPKEIEFNSQKIEVKTFIPMEEKMDMIGWILNNSADDNRFYNKMKLDVFTAIAVIEHYTNISFTDKQKENPAKLYDLITISGLFEKVLEAIGDHEWLNITWSRDDVVAAIYEYQNSVFGVLDGIANNYDQMNLDVTELEKKIANKENIGLVSEILTKLG